MHQLRNNTLKNNKMKNKTPDSLPWKPTVQKSGRINFGKWHLWLGPASFMFFWGWNDNLRGQALKQSVGRGRTDPKQGFFPPACNLSVGLLATGCGGGSCRQRCLERGIRKMEEGKDRMGMYNHFTLEVGYVGVPGAKE